jgi:eukaryotic-like serine/threonine-protein kinase
MVCVFANDFWMGSNKSSDSYAEDSETPRHHVVLSAYYIDQTEVTNRQYALCVQAGRCSPPSSSKSNTRGSYYNNANYANYPVIFVSWADAKNYCQWANRRLPTEAERK